jgi:3-dehydroquinate synthetase
VALGLLAAARVSARLLPEAVPLEARIGRALQRLGLPTDLDRRLWTAAGAPRERVAAALGLDKKRKGDQIRFVALPRPGQARLVPLSVPQLFELLRPAEPTLNKQEDTP